MGVGGRVGVSACGYGYRLMVGLLRTGWLSSRVFSVLESGAEGPGSNRSLDAVG